MAKALLTASITATLASGDECNVFGYGNDSATEANTQISCTENATFSNLRAFIESGGSGTNNFRFRDAGADGNQLATRSSAGYCEDTSSSDTLSAGDLFNIAYTDTGSNSQCSYISCNVEFASGYGCFHGAATYSGVVYDQASSTRYIGLAGPLVADGQLTRANAAWKNRGYTSWEALQVYVTANARTNNSTFENYINTSAGAASITFTSGATGLLTDTSVGDSIADADELAVGITLDTGVEDLTVGFVVATLKSSNTKQDIWAASSGNARAASSTETPVFIAGQLLPGTYTEAQTRLRVGYAGTASNLRCYLSANTYTGNGTLKLLINGSAAITTTIGAGGGAAWYENTSDTAAFDADDELSLEFDEGTSGSITIQAAGLTLAPTVAGGTGHPIFGAVRPILGGTIVS